MFPWPHRGAMTGCVPYSPVLFLVGVESLVCTTNDSTLTRNKGLLVSPLLELFLDRSEYLLARQAVKPPSTGNATPVTNAAPGEQR